MNDSCQALGFTRPFSLTHLPCQKVHHTAAAMSADQAARHASLLEASPSASTTTRHAPVTALVAPSVTVSRPSIGTSPTEVDWDR